MKHLKHGEPEALPDAAHKIREELSKLKKDDVEGYRPLVELYKIAMIKFASTRKRYLKETLRMAVDDVCLRSVRVPLAAASREMALAVGMRALQGYPKMVFETLNIIRLGSSRSTLEFAGETGKGNLENQINRVIKIAKRAKKLAEKHEATASKAAAHKAPASPNRERLPVQSGDRAPATSAQLAHK